MNKDQGLEQISGSITPTFKDSIMLKKYLNALDQGNLEKILALFSKDAVVVSPLYGTMPAEKFYKKLFVDTYNSQTSLLNIFNSTRNSAAMALHFLYKWTLKNGKTLDFECIDVFELTDDKKYFKKLTIIYDTAPVREDFSSL